MDEILKGAIDLHVHAGPSTAKREVDAAEMLKEAMAAGYRAFVVKDHYFPTMMSAQLVEKHIGNGTCKVFGGIALNNSVGGINVKAVDVAHTMGAKIVWMPTVSAKQHIDGHKGHFIGSGNSSVPEKPMVYIDEAGNLKPEVIELLEYLVQNPDIILATGHGSPKEIDALIRKATSMGVQKIMVNHPFYLIKASVDQIVEWAELGAYIELNACVFPPSKYGVTPYDIVKEILERISVHQLLIDSDFGQAGNGSPVQGILTFVNNLMKDLHVSKEDINIMLKENPAKLLEL